jgi:type I restriction enzyme M protein
MAFSPTSIPTNPFSNDPARQRNGITSSLAGGRKQYTKTQPIQFEEFGECLKWWKHRKENEHAWKVPAEEILSANCNLDRKNPHAKEDISHLPPEQLVESILQKEQRIMEIMGKSKHFLPKKALKDLETLLGR